MSEFDRGLFTGLASGAAVVLWFVLPGLWPFISYVVIAAAWIFAGAASEGTAHP